MTILAAELKLYKSSVVNDIGSNGAGMSANQIVTGVSNNIFPNIPQAERLAGSTKYRKAFYKVANDADETLANCKVFMTKQTPSTDMVTFFAGTQTEVRSTVSADGITDTKDHYGVGDLNADVSAAANVFDVLVENDAVETIFRDGDEIRISDQATLGGAGNEEFHTINTVTYVSNVATITIVGTLANAFTTAGGTHVASVLSVSDIVSSGDTFAVTSTAGTYDDTTYPLLADNIGAVEETVTLTFTSATAFDAVGSISGAMGSGAIGGDFSPNNADFTKPYFTLSTAGWGGTWATSDTLVFEVRAASTPLWCKRHVPAGATNVSGNNFKIALRGESI